MNIREVRDEDAIRIAEIYNYYIENTIITFEVDALNSSDMQGRIKEYTKKYPYVVLESDAGIVIGYAYASKFKDREAYRYSAELSIYFDHKEVGNGLSSVGQTVPPPSLIPYPLLLS